MRRGWLWDLVYECAGGRWCGNPTPPGDHKQLDLTDPRGGPTRVGMVLDDGGALWLGFPSQWRFDLDRRTARRLAVWTLWNWWVLTEWCGLRRWLWYRALSYRCERHNSWMRASGVTGPKKVG